MGVANNDNPQFCFVGLQVQCVAQGTNLVDTNKLAGGFDADDIRMVARFDLATGSAPVAGEVQRNFRTAAVVSFRCALAVACSGKDFGGIALAHTFNTGEQKGVRIGFFPEKRC